MGCTEEGSKRVWLGPEATRLVNSIKEAKPDMTYSEILESIALALKNAKIVISEGNGNGHKKKDDDLNMHV